MERDYNQDDENYGNLDEDDEFLRGLKDREDKDLKDNKKPDHKHSPLDGFFFSDENFMEPFLAQLLAALRLPDYKNLKNNFTIDYDTKIYRDNKPTKSFHYRSTSAKDKPNASKKLSPTETVTPTIRRVNNELILYYPVRRVNEEVKVMVENSRLFVFLLTDGEWKRVSARQISGYKYLGYVVQSGILKVRLGLV